MDWDEELLESWLKELNRTDNDASAIQKYALQDEGKLGVSRNDSNFQNQRKNHFIT